MKRILTFLAILSLYVSACQPSPDTYDLVKDMFVQTSYDKGINFSSYTTFTLPMDTIGQIYNLDPTDTLILGSYATQVTQQVRYNLTNAGYTFVNSTQNPDLGLNVFVVRDYDVFQTVIYPNYYAGYAGYYYPGYYGYGGYYGYPYLTYQATNTGTLVIEMVDIKNKDSQNRVKVIWTAYIGDLFTTVDPYEKSVEGINQSFLQSNYIKK